MLHEYNHVIRHRSIHAIFSSFSFSCELGYLQFTIWFACIVDSLHTRNNCHMSYGMDYTFCNCYCSQHDLSRFCICPKLRDLSRTSCVGPLLPSRCETIAATVGTVVATAAVGNAIEPPPLQSWLVAAAAAIGTAVADNIAVNTHNVVIQCQIAAVVSWRFSCGQFAGLQIRETHEVEQDREFSVLTSLNFLVPVLACVTNNHFIHF